MLNPSAGRSILIRPTPVSIISSRSSAGCDAALCYKLLWCGLWCYKWLVQVDDIMTSVIPIISGNTQSDRSTAGDIKFGNLDPITDGGLVHGQRDLWPWPEDKHVTMGAYRNARDWAKEQRNRPIQDANDKAQ